MAPAKQLLYGPRRRRASNQARRLLNAEIALKSGGRDQALDYLLKNPDDLNISAGSRNLLVNIITPSLRLTGDRYEQKEWHLAAQMNGPNQTANECNDKAIADEQERLDAALRHNYNDRPQALEAVGTSLFNTDNCGPLALRAFEGLGLEAKIALYYRLDKGLFRQQLLSYLAWRLLAEVEAPSRALAETLEIADEINPWVGDYADTLHLLSSNGYLVCDPDTAIEPCERGAWRDRPQQRCPDCASRGNQLPPGSDDPVHYTLLKPDQYYSCLDEIKTMLNEIDGLFSDFIETDLDELLEEVNARIDRYTIKLAEQHQLVIADLFARRFNQKHGRFRINYIDRAIADQDKIAAFWEFNGDEPLVKLSASEVELWLDDWLNPDIWPTISEMQEYVIKNLGRWLLQEGDDIRREYQEFV